MSRTPTSSAPGGSRTCDRSRGSEYRLTFEPCTAYHSTLFHELAHSTGHSTRLNRASVSDACPFGDTNYSKEELLAEMAAAFLCAHARIENTTIDSSASYIANWYDRLSKDRRLLIQAAAAAQKAADWILGECPVPT